jgi:hypothetical protein
MPSNAVVGNVYPQDDARHPVHALTSRRPTVMVTNVTYPEGTILTVNTTGYVLPAPGKQFTVTKAHMGQLMGLYGMRGELTTSQYVQRIMQDLGKQMVPDGYTVVVEDGEPKLVKIAEPTEE